MISLEAKISGYDGTGAVEIKRDENSASPSNISADISKVVSNRLPTRNPFIIGSSVLGDGSTFSNGEQYYIGSSFVGENGKFTTDGYSGETYNYVFRVRAEKPIYKLTIFFDVDNDRHPNKILIDEEEYEVTSPIFSCELSGRQLFTVTIVDWNERNKPLIITGIYLDLEIDVNSQNMISLNAPIAERGDLSYPSFGIISNAGSAEFTDTTGIVEQYDNMGWLTSGNKIKVSIVNTQSGKNNLLATMSISKWDYDPDNKKASVKFVDEFERWQNINVPRVVYAPTSNGTMSMIYEYLLPYTPAKYGIPKISELGSQIQDILKATPIDEYQLKEGTLWQQWNKLCVACKLHLFVGKDGKAKFTYSEGDYDDKNSQFAHF